MAAGISLFISLMTDSSRASSSYRHLRVLTYIPAPFFSSSSTLYTVSPPLSSNAPLAFSLILSGGAIAAPIHDPSISHFPGKINGANFRLYRIYNATHPVIFHLPPLSVVGISARFPIAGPIEEKITGLSSLFSWKIIRRMRHLVSRLLAHIYGKTLFIL